MAKIRHSREIVQRLREATTKVRLMRRQIRDEEVWQAALTWVMGTEEEGSQEEEVESAEAEPEE